MRTIKHLALAVFTIFTVSTFTGCKDSDPQFLMRFGTNYPYFIQSGSTGNYSFIPYFNFYVSNYTLESATVTTTASVTMSIGTRYMTNCFETVSSGASSLNALNGTYTFVATADNGSTFPFSTTASNLSDDDALGDFRVSNFEYTDGKLSYIVSESIENATDYGFLITYINSDNERYIASGSRWFDEYSDDVKAGTTADQKVTKPFSTTFNGVTEKVKVVPIAINSKIPLILADESNARYLEKGATHFTE